MKNTWPLITVAALAASLLAGCSGGGSEPPGANSPAGTSSSPPTSNQAQGESPTADGTAAEGFGAGVDAVDLDNVQAEQVYEVPGSKDKTSFGILSLQVKGKTMVLKMAMTPDFSSVSQSDAVSIFSMTGEQTMWPRLVDRENLKEYSIVGSHSWAANALSTEATNGKPAVWWGVYAAPEDDIEAVDIQVLDGMPAFTNVPIQR